MSTVDDQFARRVQFSDGEGVDPTDFALMQQRALRSLADAFLYYGIYDGIDDPTTSDAVAYVEGGQNLSTLAIDWASDIVMCPFPGSGMFIPNGSNNQLVSVPGPMVLVNGNPSLSLPGVGAPAANDANVVMCKLGGFALGDLTFTLDVGDATNPRIDLIEIKVTYIDGTPTNRDFKDATTGVVTTTTPNKERWVRVTAQINKGTPSATPAYPTPTAGFRAITAVIVPATSNAPIDPGNVRDLRWPLGNVDVYDVCANAMLTPVTTGNQWSYTIGGTPAPQVAGPPAGTQSAYALCPFSGNNGRLLAVGAQGMAGSGSGGSWLCRFDTALLSTATDLVQLNARLLSATYGYNQAGAIRLMATGPTGGSPADGTRAAGTRVGHPYWTNGWHAGPVLGRPPITSTPLAHQYQLAARFAATADITTFVQKVRWFIARGL